MDTNDIKYLYEYDRWANARVLEVVRPLTREEFTREIESSHRSIRDTLSHILAAEWIWLMRWKGTSPTALLDPADFPDVASIGDRLAEVERDQMIFLDSLTDEQLHRKIAYTNTKGEKWQYPLVQLMQHVVNHSSYHRGQVTALLRLLGRGTISTDFLIFIDAERR
jgi:uncharacterized damage-inducible protein DinB